MFDTHHFLSFQVHGSAGHGGGVSSSVETLLTFLESLVGLSPADMFSTIFPGISSLVNIHPLVVHFPIALLLAFFVVDLLGSLLKKDNWRSVASGMLYLGTLMAGVAVLAGLSAEETVDHGANVHEILETHEAIGISILCLSVMLSIWRLISGGIVKGLLNIPYVLMSFLLVILVILGADLGGLMVYKYGVAVEAVKVTSMDYFEEHTHSH